MGRPTELIVGPTELDLGPQKNRRFKESIWSILVGQNWKNDISWCKKSNNFFGSKFPKVYIFSHKKTGWVLTFLVVVVFLVGSLEKHGDSPLDFRTPMIDQVILGTVSLGPPDPRIASDAFLVPFGFVALALWRFGASEWCLTGPVSGWCFWGGTWTSQSREWWCFFLYTLKVGILFQTLRNRSIFFKTTRFLASHFLSLNFCAFWKGAFGWNIIFWAVLHDFCKGAMDGSHVFLLNDKLKGLQSSVWVVRTKQFWMVINFEVDLRDEVFVTETNPFRKDVPGLLTSETAQYLRGGFTHWFWDWTWMTRFCGACAPRSLFTEMPRKVQNQIKVRKVCVDLWGIKKWQIQNVMKRGVTFQSYVFCASLARRSRLTHHSLQFGFEKS